MKHYFTSKFTIYYLDLVNEYKGKRPNTYLDIKNLKFKIHIVKKIVVGDTDKAVSLQIHIYYLDLINEYNNKRAKLS